MNEFLNKTAKYIKEPFSNGMFSFLSIIFLLNELCFIVHFTILENILFMNFAILQNTRRQAENPAFQCINIKLGETVVLIDLFHVTTPFFHILIFYVAIKLCHGKILDLGIMVENVIETMAQYTEFCE